MAMICGRALIISVEIYVNILRYYSMSRYRHDFFYSSLGHYFLSVDNLLTQAPISIKSSVEEHMKY